MQRAHSCERDLFTRSLRPVVLCQLTRHISALTIRSTKRRAGDMQTYSKCHNLKIDGGEYTTGLLGLDWFPSTGASARKQRYEMDIVKTLDRLAGSWTGWAVINEIFFRQWQMTIHPYFADPVNGQFNAYAQ